MFWITEKYISVLWQSLKYRGLYETYREYMSTFAAARVITSKLQETLFPSPVSLEFSCVSSSHPAVQNSSEDYKEPFWAAEGSKI